MDEVLTRGIRCVSGQIPPAAKPRGSGQNEDLWLLCPAAYRTKKPMNGKASLLAGTKESGYAGEISLGVLMKMLEDKFATPAAIDPRVIIKAKSLEERSKLIHDLAQSCARAMESLMQEELKDYLSHPCTDDGCFLRRYFPNLLHCCHDIECKKYELHRPSPIKSTLDGANKLRTFETHLATLQAALYPSVYVYHAGMKDMCPGAREAESGFNDSALVSRLQNDLCTVSNLLRDLGNEKGLSQDRIDDLEMVALRM